MNDYTRKHAQGLRTVRDWRGRVICYTNDPDLHARPAARRGLLVVLFFALWLYSMQW